MMERRKKRREREYEPSEQTRKASRGNIMMTTKGVEEGNEETDKRNIKKR